MNNELEECEMHREEAIDRFRTEVDLAIQETVRLVQSLMVTLVGADPAEAHVQALTEVKSTLEAVWEETVIA